MSDDYKTYEAAPGLLRDRIILITGASDGIGGALAIRTAELGGQVILHGRNVQKLEKVYDEVEAIENAPRPSIAVLDLASANSAAYESLANNLAEEYGRLDGLVLILAWIGGSVVLYRADRASQTTPTSGTDGAQPDRTAQRCDGCRHECAHQQFALKRDIDDAGAFGKNARHGAQDEWCRNSQRCVQRQQELEGEVRHHASPAAGFDRTSNRASNLASGALNM